MRCCGYFNVVRNAVHGVRVYREHQLRPAIDGIRRTGESQKVRNSAQSSEHRE